MLTPIPALNDNYIWVYGRENCAVIVIDIPEFSPLWIFLQQNQLDVEAVLLTHHHDDHIGGVAEFKQHFPHVPIYASAECADKGATQICNAGWINTAHYAIQVIPTAGHTAQHVSYFVDGNLFCGDSLFSAGCGRVFTGDYNAMYQGLQRLKDLPDSTEVCCGHEYTQSNLAFAETVLQDKSAVKTHQDFVARQRAENRPSLPSSIGLEKQINPFLRAKNLDEFIELRLAKDRF